MAKKSATKKGSGRAVKTSKGKPVKKAAKKEAAEKVPGLNVGLKTGKKLCDFINSLFVKELRTAAAKRMTDEQLMKEIAKEFPKRDSFQSIGSYRSYFNGGQHGFGNPPNTAIPKDKRLKKVKE